MTAVAWVLLTIAVCEGILIVFLARMLLEFSAPMPDDFQSVRDRDMDRVGVNSWGEI